MDSKQLNKFSHPTGTGSHRCHDSVLQIVRNLWRTSGRDVDLADWEMLADRYSFLVGTRGDGAEEAQLRRRKSIPELRGKR